MDHEQEEKQITFEEAVANWRQKYDITDDDPMLASVELMEIFFQNVKVQVPDSSTGMVVELGKSLHELNRLGKSFSRQTRELLQEIRGLPKLRQTLAVGRTWAILSVAIAMLVAGILIGKFVL
jgi:hypothetical protein